VYNSIGVYVLSAIVQRVTGQKMLDYLKPRLFQPLGITQADWEESPAGENTGGWGLRLTTEALAKVGQLYLQKGVWNGQHILPEAWVAEATSLQIDQGPGWAAHSIKDSSDWLQGYGYLFWRCRHHCYRADGAFGQYIIVMPDEDAVLAITCETRDLQDELNLVWRFVLPAFHDGALPADEAADAALRSRTASLALAPPSGISGDHTTRSLLLKPNSYGYNEMDLSWTGEVGHLTFKTAESTYAFDLGNGKWITQKSMMKGPYLVARAANAQAGLAPFLVSAAYAWKDSQTLEIQLRYIESPHTETITCHFEGQGMRARVHKSFEDASADQFLSTSNP
jgi:CubicO group peptidase (beta-lactamase class C family)